MMKCTFHDIWSSLLNDPKMKGFRRDKPYTSHTGVPPKNLAADLGIRV
jgi:hypothetical protein